MSYPLAALLVAAVLLLPLAALLVAAVWRLVVAARLRRDYARAADLVERAERRVANGLEIDPVDRAALARIIAHTIYTDAGPTRPGSGPDPEPSP